MYSERRAMFKAEPIRFIVLVLLIPVFGLGALVLLIWWLECRFQTLSLQNGLLAYRKGVLSKQQVELPARMVRSVRVDQSLLQRLMNTGDIFIISSGSSPEIIAKSMPSPKLLREQITTYNSAVPLQQ